MQVTPALHALKIPFQIPIAPGKLIDRVVYSYLVLAETITVIDCGVAGSADLIFDYLNKNGRGPKEITRLVLSHSHHLGGAQALQRATGCQILAHGAERPWIEDTDRQSRERPVPGFHSLVEGPLTVDRVLADGETLVLGAQVSCRVIHTPGHSSGSISLLFPGERALTTADSLPLPNDLPIYDDLGACLASIERLKRIDGVDTLLSSWEPPLQGKETIQNRFAASLSYLHRIHAAVLAAKAAGKAEPMELCAHVVNLLGLPPFAANPLVAKAFASSLALDNQPKNI